MKGNWLLYSKAELPCKHLSVQPASPPSPEPSNKLLGWALGQHSREGWGLVCSSPPWDLLNWALSFPKGATVPQHYLLIEGANHPSKADANEEQQPISNLPADSSGVPASCMCCRVFTYPDCTKSLLQSSFEVIQAVHVLGYF